MLNLEKPKMPRLGLAQRGFHLFSLQPGSALVIEDIDGVTVIIPEDGKSDHGREFTFIWPSGFREKVWIKYNHHYKAGQNTPLSEMYYPKENKTRFYRFCDIGKIKYYEKANLKNYKLSALAEENWPSINELSGSVPISELMLNEISLDCLILVKTITFSKILKFTGQKSDLSYAFTSYHRNRNGKITEEKIVIPSDFKAFRIGKPLNANGFFVRFESAITDLNLKRT